MKSVKNYIHHVDMKNLGNSGDSQKQKEGKFNSIYRHTQKNFINASLMIKIESKMHIMNGNKELQIDKTQIVYMIDRDGFLLDSESRYILDHSNQQIKLST